MGQEPSKNDVAHFGGGGFCQKVMLLHEHINLRWQGGGRVQNLKKLLMSFMDGPQTITSIPSVNSIFFLVVNSFEIVLKSHLKLYLKTKLLCVYSLWIRNSEYPKS